MCLRENSDSDLLFLSFFRYRQTDTDGRMFYVWALFGIVVFVESGAETVVESGEG